MKFKKWDLIKTTSNKEHATVIKTLKERGFRIDSLTWDDRYEDHEDGYKYILYKRKRFEAFDKDDLKTFGHWYKIKRKFKASEVISSYRTSYGGNKLKHRFF